MPAITSATGGTISSGTYALTSAAYYSGSNYSADAGVPTEAVEFIIDATNSTFILLETVTGVPPITISGSYVALTNTITLAPTCPTGTAGSTVNYTASSNTVTIYDYTSDTVEVFTAQ